MTTELRQDASDLQSQLERFKLPANRVAETPGGLSPALLNAVMAMVSGSGAPPAPETLVAALGQLDLR